MGLIVFLFESMTPINFVQVEEHSLLDFTLSIVNGYGVIVLVKTSC